MNPRKVGGLPWKEARAKLRAKNLATGMRNPGLGTRILSKVEKDQWGCWVWQGRLHMGYGKLWDSSQRRSRGAHCMSYELFVGPIPTGLEIDHLCENRACVNPKHLEPVTHAENMKRAAQNRKRRKTLVKNMVAKHAKW